VTWSHRVFLFGVGVTLSVGLFLLGGIAAGPHPRDEYHSILTPLSTRWEATHP
jgi:hypothetical protein